LNIAEIKNAKGRMATEDSGEGKRGHLMRGCDSWLRSLPLTL